MIELEFLLKVQYLQYIIYTMQKRTQQSYFTYLAREEDAAIALNPGAFPKYAVLHICREVRYIPQQIEKHVRMVDHQASHDVGDSSPLFFFD